MMNNNFSDDSSKKNGFGDLMNSMNEFFHERPAKGILQSIDSFFSSSHNPFGAFPVELEETKTHYIVEAQLPGVKKEAIDIDIYPQHITITVNNEEDFTEENEQNHSIKRRRSVQKSTRTIPFSTAIDDRNTKASYRDGLLTLKLTKLSGKKIEIE
jgi:HSP20 family protein